ncbi:hypothetical protein SAY86_015228 [Trapa natans]|uniref:Uncharacterized protein n=1 Tax=Trapa natans TaxID=22666 RepID=A0AAN7QHN5_TRANT|nr:hypothetical protein SAY86_015228 [Trapa natans]
MENPIAVDSFFLVEGVGDSEADSNSAWNACSCETGGWILHDQDDAESCSCDSFDDLRLLEVSNSCESCGDVIAAAGSVEDELLRDQFPIYRIDLFDQDLQSTAPSDEHKSWDSAESTSPAKELVNEREKSRQFWEACLASS